MSELPFWAQQEYRAREAEEQLRKRDDALRYVRAELASLGKVTRQTELFELVDYVDEVIDPVDVEEREAEYEQALEDEERGAYKERLHGPDCPICRSEASGPMDKGELNRKPR